jgi:hypothetical protein
LGGLQKKKHLIFGLLAQNHLTPPPPLILGPLNRWKKDILNLVSTGPEQCFVLWGPQQVHKGEGTKLPWCVSTLVGIDYISCNFLNKACLRAWEEGWVAVIIKKNRKIAPSCDSYLNTLCSVLYAVYSMYCVICNVLCVLYSMQCILSIVFYVSYYMHFIPCIVFYTLDYMHWILCIIFYALDSMH